MKKKGKRVLPTLSRLLTKADEMRDKTSEQERERQRESGGELKWRDKSTTGIWGEETLWEMGEQ